MRHSRGFTLIELLVVVVIVAILAAIAVPSYREFVLRSQRSDATIALTEIAALQEKFFSDSLRYSGTIADTPQAESIYYPLQSMNDLYDISIATSANVGYVITAQATGTQVQDSDCQTLTLNGSGQRGSSPEGPDVCWR